MPLSGSQNNCQFVLLYQHADARLRGANPIAAPYMQEDAVFTNEL